MAIETLQIHGVEVHIEGSGARTVVMLHGWPDTLQLWDATVQALQPQYRCVRFTLPGFGQVDARLPPPTVEDMTSSLLAIIQAVSPHAPVTLLLHDWGCVFGYELAMRHPSHIEAIVAVDIGDHNAGAYLASLSMGQKLSIASYQLWLAWAWVVGRYVHQGIANGMTRFMARVARCPSPQAPLRWTMNFPYAMRWLGVRGGLRTAAVKPTCPVLFVYGEGKPFMFHSSRWVHDLRARAHSAAHGLRSGHWVMLDQPDAFHALLLRWLSSGDRRRVPRS
ncbi:MAG: alpha/beta hydrolase [Rhodoferax sp.]|nr:alpha/beta hydrolase [Rhodoferax sp.]